MSKNKYNTLFGSAELKVSPQVMHNTADAISKSVTSISEKFDALLEKVEDTSSYWDSETANYTRNRFSGEQDNMKSLLNNINSYVSELSTITMNYETAESKITEAAESLPTNILN